jgi:membrane protein YqaA with SNARE-associated domain
VKFLFNWYDRVMVWSRHPKAPWYLGAVSFADSSVFPISPVVMIIPMTLSMPLKAFRWAWIATLFSVFGGCVGYALGKWAFQPLLLPLIEQFGYMGVYQSALKAFGTWGYWALFFAAFIPVPYKFFTIGAGVLSLNLPLFLLSSCAGRGLRFSIIAGLIRFGGPKMEGWFRRYLDKQEASMRNN